MDGRRDSAYFKTFIGEIIMPPKVIQIATAMTFVNGLGNTPIVTALTETGDVWQYGPQASVQDKTVFQWRKLPPIPTTQS